MEITYVVNDHRLNQINLVQAHFESDHPTDKEWRESIEGVLHNMDPSAPYGPTWGDGINVQLIGVLKGWTQWLNDDLLPEEMQ